MQALDVRTEKCLRKRRMVLECIEQSPGFFAASAEARAMRPVPEAFTKRQWERELGHWRAQLRASGQRDGRALEVAPLQPISSGISEAGGSLYPYIRMFTQSDVQRIQ